jgi:hypothetical protein
MVAVSKLIPLLDADYEQKCYELGIIQRRRVFKNAADLMLLCLFHLINGCTLLEISEVGRLTKIGQFSDVAFMDKFGQCTEWFRWVSEKLMQGIVADYAKPAYLDGYRVIAFDASDVVEKGSSKQIYRLHYGIDIFTMSSVAYKITKQETGEALRNFPLRSGDLVVADRIYGTLTGMNYCAESGADYILRIKAKCFNLYDADGAKLDILQELSGLAPGDSRDVHGYANYNGTRFPIRVCALRKTPEQCAISRKRLKRKSSKKQMTISENALDFNDYIVVATSLSPDVSAADILETYRFRWQVECYFKRLKSIMAFGDLPKKRENSILAWLNGKMMVALMTEMLLSQESFSPKGIFGLDAQYLEGDQDDCIDTQDKCDPSCTTYG